MQLLLAVLMGAVIVTELVAMTITVILQRRQQKADIAEVNALSALKETLEKEGQKARATIAENQRVISEQIARQLAPMIDPPPQASATRVYAAILTKDGTTRLYMATARSIDEFKQTGEAIIGSAWKAQDVASIDVFPPEKEIVYVPQKATKTEKKALGVQEFVHQIEYARDTFAETDFDKRALDRIITNVKQKYAAV